MSPELQGVIIGGLIGSASSIIGIFISHWLDMRREKYHMKLEAEQEFRKRFTEGVSPNIYNKGMEKIFTMIDEGKLPRSYAVDPKFFDDLLDDLLEDNKKVKMD